MRLHNVIMACSGGWQVDDTLRLARDDDHAGPPTSLICAAALDQSALVIGAADGLVHVARVDGPTRTYSLTAFDGLQRRSPITAVRVCDDWILLLQSPSNRILQVDRAFSETVRFVNFQDDAILCFEVADSGVLIAGDANGCVFAWNVYDGRTAVSVIHSEPEPIAAVALDADRQLVFMVTSNGRLVAYDMQADAVAAVVQYEIHASIASLWSGHQGAVVADASGQVLAVSMAETRFEKALEWSETDNVVSAAVHNSGLYVALGMINGHVVVRSLHDPTVIFGQHVMNSAVVAVEFVGNDEKSPRLIVASYLGSIEIWPVSVSDDAGHDDRSMDKTLEGETEAAQLQAGDECVEAIDADAPSLADLSAIHPNAPTATQAGQDSSKDNSIIQPRGSSDTESDRKTAAPGFSASLSLDDRDVDTGPDDWIQPRLGPAPTPEPPVHVGDQRHSLPEVGLTTATEADEAIEPIAAVPNPIEPCHSLAVLPSVAVGRFSSKERIDALLSRSSRQPSESVLAAPSLNSSSWIQYQIDQLASSALTEPPEIDVKLVSERAASKAAYVDPAKTGIFGELPPIEVDLPPPSRPQIPKQVDPKWIRSLDRRPVMEASLNREDLEPQIPGCDPNWSVASSSHQRPSVQNTDPVYAMGDVLMQRISYWDRGII